MFGIGIKKLFCRHEWTVGRRLEDKEGFVCKKCGKEFWWWPEKKEINDEKNNIYR